jgi:tetratricopeptide (TPR) repeat protein
MQEPITDGKRLLACEIDETLSDLESAPLSDVIGFLRKLGVDASELKGLEGAKVTKAVRLEGNLDEDPDLESLVQVEVAAMGTAGAMNTSAVLFLAWLNSHDQGMKPLGSRSFKIGSCLIEGSVSVELRTVRSPAINDVVVEWADAPSCDGNYALTKGTAVFALLEEEISPILQFSDYSETARLGYEVIDPELSLRLDAEMPARALIESESGEVLYSLGYDAAVRRYTLQAELAASEAAKVGRLSGREWVDRCFRHIKKQRYSSALAACQEASQLLEPQDSNLIGALEYNFGRIYLDIGDKTKATTHLLKSLSARPGNSVVEKALEVARRGSDKSGRGP